MSRLNIPKEELYINVKGAALSSRGRQSKNTIKNTIDDYRLESSTLYENLRLLTSGSTSRLSIGKRQTEAWILVESAGPLGFPYGAEGKPCACQRDLLEGTGL